MTISPGSSTRHRRVADANDNRPSSSALLCRAFPRHGKLTLPHRDLPRLCNGEYVGDTSASDDFHGVVLSNYELNFKERRVIPVARARASRVFVKHRVTYLFSASDRDTSCARARAAIYPVYLHYNERGWQRATRRHVIHYFTELRQSCAERYILAGSKFFPPLPRHTLHTHGTRCRCVDRIDQQHRKHWSKSYRFNSNVIGTDTLFVVSITQILHATAFASRAVRRIAGTFQELQILIH